MTETPPVVRVPGDVPVTVGAGGALPGPGIGEAPALAHQYIAPPGGWMLAPGAPVPPGWAPVPGRPGWVTPARSMPPPPAGSLAANWRGPTGGARSAALVAIIAAAVVAAVSLVLTLPGFGWLLTGAAIAAAALVTAWGRRKTTDAEGSAASPPIIADDVPTAAGPADATGWHAPPAAADVGPQGVPADVGGEGVTADVGGEAVTADVGGEDGAADVGSDDAVVAGSVDAGPDALTEVGRAPAVVWVLARRYGERAFWTAAALALLSVGTFRAAGWLYFWCVVVALGCGAYALAGGRTVKAMTLAVLAFVGAPFMSIGWVFRGVAATRRNRGNGPRVVIAVAVSLVLVLVFGGLFAGADAEFRHIVTSILPPLSAPEIARAIFCFVIIAVFASGVAFLAAAPPTLDRVTSTSARTLRRVEWVLPLAVLNVLFAAFDAVQLAVLFNPDRSLATASHKYMKGYAHSGFWQLLAVTLLTLSVLAVAGRFAPREERTDRMLFRVLLGVLTVFSLVIVASALKRLAAYETSYGYTRLRVVVGAVEVWLGVVFVFVLIASLMLRAGWLPRVVAGSLAVALFAGAVANPDRYVADHNVARYYRTHTLSVEYMAQLSADAAPAIAKLPPRLAGCSAVFIWQALAARADDWRTWNFARVDARVTLARIDIPSRERGCPHLVR